MPSVCLWSILDVCSMVAVPSWGASWADILCTESCHPACDVTTFPNENDDHCPLGKNVQNVCSPAAIEADCRHDDTQQGCQTNCLFATHKPCKVINTAIYTIGQIRQLNLKGSLVCERTRGGSSGLPDHVWFGSGRATSAQQAYDLSAVHAPFCCSHGSSQAVGCMLSVPFFGWYLHMT